jgi:hypothetical protein
LVWEDAAASVNWNAQLFEFLTRLVENPVGIEVKECEQRVRVLTPRFAYMDTPKKVRIVSWWPPRSMGFHLYTKREPKARASVYPVELYGRFRSMFARKVEDE